MSKQSEGRTHYDTLELAIAGWGKWAGSPWKVADARAALDSLIEIIGTPSGADGATAYYAREGYVNVTWSGKVGFQVQVGSMHCQTQLAAAWQPDVTAPRPDWFMLPFADHRPQGTASNRSGVATAVCANGCWPGLKLRIGSLCSDCEEPISAAANA